jgi:WD40 repeat protein
MGVRNRSTSDNRKSSRTTARFMCVSLQSQSPVTINIFTSGSEHNGHVKQFSVSDGQMVKDYGPIFGNYEVRLIITTPDNKYLFAASTGGHLKQISLETQQLVHDYGKIHDRRISCLETTRDSKWLIIGGFDKHVKRISIKNRQVDKDFGQVCDY